MQPFHRHTHMKSPDGMIEFSICYSIFRKKVLKIYRKTNNKYGSPWEEVTMAELEATVGA